MQVKSAEVMADFAEKEGLVVAYAATFDRVPDSYGDVIAKGAFSDTLNDWAERKDSIPVLFGHRTDDPLMNIGVVTDACEDEKGLRVEIQLDLDNERGAYTYKLLKEGRISKLSFAFSVLESGTVDIDGYGEAHELRKLDLFEVSIVPIPANPLTEVIEVRSAGKTAQGEEQTADDAQGVKATDVPADVVEYLVKRIDDILYK